MAPVTDTSQQFRKTPSPINPTQTPPPNPTPTRPACLEEPGQLVISEIEDPRLQRPLPIRIYLPPCYAEDQGHRYPTLYLLHGLGADDSQWDDLGIAETANHLISDERLPALLIVMPWHRTGIDLDDAISEVLIPFIDREYRTQPGAFWRAIGGISRGGGLALRIGMRHPDLFRSIGLHSPANIYSRPYITRWSTAISEVNMPRLWVDIGDRDPLLSSTYELISLLEELDIPALTNINSGEHSPDYWSAHLEDYLLWYADEWAKQL